MKEIKRGLNKTRDLVAPLVGAWIERITPFLIDIISDVAPLVGAWIERLPSGTHELIKIVAPLVGAWIERMPFTATGIPREGRSSCRSVD